MAATGLLTTTLFESCLGCSKAITAELTYSITLGETPNLSENAAMGIPATINVTGVRIAHDCTLKPRTGGTI